MTISNHLTAVFTPAKEGGFVGYMPEMQDIAAQGETIEEVRSNLIDALELMLAVRRDMALKTGTYPL